VNGTWKPYLRDASGRFVEYVDLVPITPDVAGTLNAVTVQAALMEISAKLDVVIQNVENLAALVRLANRGGLQGGAVGKGRTSTSAFREAADSQLLWARHTQRRHVYPQPSNVCETYPTVGWGASDDLLASLFVLRKDNWRAIKRKLAGRREHDDQSS
jgi:hypothetical protein